MMARIFLCHATEDKAQVREVYHRLQASDGFEPWLDEEDLLPGQEWEREVQRALQTSDFILIFLSRTSVAKRGYVQREMKLALDAWQELPEGTIHTIPVRIDERTIPTSQWKLFLGTTCTHFSASSPSGRWAGTTACRLKRSGNMRAVLVQTPPATTMISTLSHGTRRTATLKRSQSVRNCRMRGGYTTCLAIYGSGATMESGRIRRMR